MSDLKDESYCVDLTTSCTVNDAIKQLLGVSPSTSNDLSDSELADVDTLENLLSCILEDAETDYLNAKPHKQTDKEIAANLERLNRAKLLIDNARRYRIDIVDELSNGSKSKLKRDLIAETVSNGFYITITSFNKWAFEKYGINLSKNAANAVPLEHSYEPWNLKDPSDPNPIQPWYTPARYFARQLIKNDLTLDGKRGTLVKKIAEELTRIGICKRGGKKPLSPETIKKSLANIKLM